MAEYQCPGCRVMSTHHGEQMEHKEDCPEVARQAAWLSTLPKMDMATIFELQGLSNPKGESMTAKRKTNQMEGNEPKHTPGPWIVDPEQTDEIIPPDTLSRCRIATVGGPCTGYTTDEANARRIVACVNACEGIPTEALEAGVVSDLLEALHHINNWARKIEESRGCLTTWGLIAREAIAKAEGKQP